MLAEKPGQREEIRANRLVFLICGNWLVCEPFVTVIETSERDVYVSTTIEQKLDESVSKTNSDIYHSLKTLTHVRFRLLFWLNHETSSFSDRWIPVTSRAHRCLTIGPWLMPFFRFELLVFFPRLSLCYSCMISTMYTQQQMAPAPQQQQKPSIQKVDLVRVLIDHARSYLSSVTRR